MILHSDAQRKQVPACIVSVSTFNDGVCEVDENGLLTAWQSGTATITVRAADSDFV